MSFGKNEVPTPKYQSSTVFLINLVINGYAPKRTPNEIRELIVLFTYAKGDYNTVRTFVADIAGWQMQINISFTESKINKLVNTQMSENDIPVYLPYVVERKWSMKRLKQEILEMNGIDGDLHEEYTLWMWRKRIWNTKDKRHTWFLGPYENKIFQTGFQAYLPVIEGKKWRVIDRKLKVGIKYILSKDKPRCKGQGNLYGLGWRGSDNWKHYTKSQLFKSWGGKDLTKQDDDQWWEESASWHPPKDWVF